MNDVIYLVVDEYGVKRMTKNLPGLSKGEYPIKLNVEVKDSAFREPTVEKTVVVEDWRQGVDIADVEFQETTITEEEAQLIRERRLEKMKEVLEHQGYKISKPEEV